jgi:hypothetical protein
VCPNLSKAAAIPTYLLEKHLARYETLLEIPVLLLVELGITRGRRRRRNRTSA